MLPARWTLRILFSFCCAALAAAAQAEPVRVSAWYWLNSAPASEWERDFRNMRDLGFTDAVLCWGLDAAAFSYRQKDTHRALDLCRRAGLGCYLMIWHPTHNSLPRRPEFQQRDIAGHLRFTFDVFNPRWRNSQWKTYLQKVAGAYKNDPALAGYVFDDSFGIGPLDHFGGAAGPASERVLPGGEKRAGGWEDWARDTTQFIRAVDSDPHHEIYLEDEEHVLSERMREAVGVDFGRVAKHFDAVGAYTAAAWDSPDAGARVAAHTREVLEKTRAAIGPDKKIIYTFWAANIAEERKPGPARFPTVDQIRQIAEAALEFGIHHLDLYGYRIGDWVVSADDWPQRRPGTGAIYPVTGQFPGKFLYDRPEIHDGLRAFLRSLASPAAQLEQPQPRSWLPEPRTLSSAVTDDDSQTYEVLCTGPGHDPCDVGLEWKSPQTIGELGIDYATLAGRAYQPAPSGQTLEYWSAEGWHPTRASIDIDYRQQAEFAPLEGSGAVRWTYRFAPIATTRVRVLLTEPQNADPGHRCYAVRSLRASKGDSGPAAARFRVFGKLPSMPSWLEPGADLAVPAAGAEVVPGKAAEIRWPRRLLVNRVNADPAADSLDVEWWDGLRWRSVEPLPTVRQGEARFAPISTDRLRVTSSGPAIRRVEARLDSEAARYFSEVEQARTDLLGERFRRGPRLDLAAMQSLLLPLDFAKVAIGRPADREETIVLWTGTFLMVEAGQHDRWFAPAAGAERKVFGADWVHTSARYLDGYLPATVTTYDDKGIAFEERLYVTPPGDELYGTVAEVTVTNRSGAAAQTGFTLAMGRRRSQHGPGAKSSPFYFDPELTGYRLDTAGRTVRSAVGDVILFAETAGAWGGTPRENHLRYSLSLAPGESRTLRFFGPSVEKPLRSAEALRSFDWQASLERFRSWWRRKLDAGMKIEVPEPQLNAIYKNLLAQALIITLDDDRVKYGAYFYESYFGVEEGWPAVALAQYGHAAEAQKILSIMLSPELMDKRNYHHQYRNGLEPWYAATIYRLTRDRAWLEKIAPDLQAAAEWTIRTTKENHDAKYPGILPRHAYGGDIHAPAYSFYSNATCWRGLHDTALVFRSLGRTEQAERYEQEAERYRRRLLELAGRLADSSTKPPFLPMSFEIGSGAEHRDKEPAYGFLGANVPAGNTWVYLGNYWNLFAPMLLELKLFESGIPRAGWIPGYMEAHGGVLAGLARFTLGLDQIYGKGYYESLLESGRRDEFLTSLYGILAHGMSQNLNSFPEVAGVFPLRTSNAALWGEYQRNLWNWYFLWNWGLEGWQNCEGEPLSAGPGMALQILRMALVRETIESPPQDTLRLLDGAPAHWFEPGKKIVVRDAPTFFGTVSLETEAAVGNVRARVTRSPGFTARQVILRLASPSGRPLRRVLIDGKPWSDFSDEEIRLPSAEHVEIAAVY